MRVEWGFFPREKNGRRVGKEKGVSHEHFLPAVAQCQWGVDCVEGSGHSEGMLLVMKVRAVPVGSVIHGQT